MGSRKAELCSCSSTSSKVLAGAESDPHHPTITPIAKQKYLLPLGGPGPPEGDDQAVFATVIKLG